VKEYLSRKGVSYTEHDVAKDQQAREDMLRKTGRMAVPTIMVDDQVVVGFNQQELDRLLH
jgi:glutaredoxin